MSSSSTEENIVNFYVSAMMEMVKIILEMEGDEGTSKLGTRNVALNRDMEAEYFDENFVYNEQFRHHFRIRRRLFLRIANNLANLDGFFTLRNVARKKRGFTTLQKCTSAIRQMVYDTASDSRDEYLMMSARTSLGCLYEFFKGAVKLYNKVYLHGPTKKDIRKLYSLHNLIFEDECRAICEYNLNDTHENVEYEFFKGVVKLYNKVYLRGPTKDIRKLYSLHNLIFEDERRAICKYNLNDIYENVELVDETHQESNMWALHSDYVHKNLCANLIDHIWNNFSSIE